MWSWAGCASGHPLDFSTDTSQVLRPSGRVVFIVSDGLDTGHEQSAGREDGGEHSFSGAVGNHLAHFVHTVNAA